MTDYGDTSTQRSISFTFNKLRLIDDYARVINKSRSEVVNIAIDEFIKSRKLNK